MRKDKESGAAGGFVHQQELVVGEGEQEAEEMPLQQVLEGLQRPMLKAVAAGQQHLFKHGLQAFHGLAAEGAEGVGEAEKKPPLVLVRK